jgi:acetylornithine deacetylase
VIDVRTNELYSNQEAYEILKNALQSEVTPRSFRLNSSKIDLKHPIVRRGMELGLTYYGSPTSSDQAVMPFTTIKIGVGDSARSHTADEFVYLHEIEQGIEIYIQLLQGLKI